MTKLKQLSPFGPIFAKELRTTARRKRTYWLRTIYLGTLFLFLLLAYTSVSQDRGGSVAEKARKEAELGLAFFQTFAMFSVFAMPLIAPILTSTAISSERLGRTLNVLLMTPITSWQIVSGKLFSRLLVALTLLALNLPVLAVVRLLGGVDVDAMLAVLCLCATVAVLAAAIGLFFSTLINRSYAVILMSYVTMFLFYGIVPFILVLLYEASGVRRFPPRFFIGYVSITNPMCQVVNLLSPRGQFLPGVWSWAYCAIFHLVAASGLVPLTGWLLRRRIRREGEAAGTAPSDAAPVTGEVVKASSRRTRDVGRNPVLWRELRRPLFAKRWQAITGAILSVALLIFTYILLANQYSNQLKAPETHVGYAFIFYTLILLLTCVLAGTAVTAEKESDTWTLLLATPLRGGDVVRGKVGGVLRRVMWPAILFGVHLVLFATFGVLSWTGVAIVIWVTLTFTSVWISVGVYFSLKLKNNTFAVVASLVTPLVVFLGVPVVLAIIDNLLSIHGRDDLAESVLYYVPYLYISDALIALSRDRAWSWNRASGGFAMPYMHGDMTPLNFLQFVLFAGLVHLSVAWAILRRIAARFDRTVGRAPQGTPLPRTAIIGVASPS